MGSRSLLVLLLLVFAGVAGFYVLTEPRPLAAEDLPAHKPDLANGETMFWAGGCASCHATPQQEDKKLLGGGLKLGSPFGTFAVPNISPDPEHGIGRWSEVEFVNAMVRGLGRGGEHLYPAFPYTSYQRMALADVRDLFAYLRTLKPVPTPSPAHELPFPYSFRRGLGLWKLIYLDGMPFKADPARSSELNRGAYLVEGPAHCAECHSPRDAFGGIDAQRRFAGGPDPEGKGWVPNITPHEDGIASYSAKDIAYLLETGTTPEFDSVGSTMALVVESTAKLTPEDRAAIAAYIKSLPPRPGKRPQRSE
ncbi:MAG TPA: cytochrome c [Hyphomicrobiaceae bacterium]|nr:cytochrome c [Hyphomicrobiaceae bacterium]